MPRKSLVLSNECVYHVVNRSNNREWFYLSLDEAWPIFCRILSLSSGLYETEIHAFVLMANHFHLLVATRRENLGLFMRYFQTEVCRGIQRRTGRINHVFGARYKWTTLWDSFSYAVALKYVFRNPVKAGLVTDVKEYPYSSIHLDSQGFIPIVERIDEIRSQVPKNVRDRLIWLNTPTSKESDELVKRGLRRSTFLLSEGRERILHQELVSLRYRVSSETTHPLPLAQK